MSKKLFTDREIKILSKNKYIKNVTKKAITYTDEFKEKVVCETADNKKFPRQVFEECNIDIEIIGEKRMYSSVNRWRSQFKKIGQIKDSRKGNSGRRLNRELSEAEKLKRAEAKIRLLEIENELLKKNNLIQQGILTYKNICKWKT